jgi:hypothetical protein
MRCFFRWSACIFCAVPSWPQGKPVRPGYPPSRTALVAAFWAADGPGKDQQRRSSSSPLVGHTICLYIVLGLVNVTSSFGPAVSELASVRDEAAPATPTRASTLADYRRRAPWVELIGCPRPTGSARSAAYRLCEIRGLPALRDPRPTGSARSAAYRLCEIARVDAGHSPAV